MLLEFARIGGGLLGAALGGGLTHRFTKQHWAEIAGPDLLLLAVTLLSGTALGAHFGAAVGAALATWHL